MLGAGSVAAKGMEGEFCCGSSPTGLVQGTCNPGLVCHCEPDSYCELETDADGNPTGVKAGKAGICGLEKADPFCPITPLSITEILENIIKWMLYIAMVVAPAMLIIGAIVFMTSAGNPERIKTARRIIVWTIIGFVIILFGRGIFSIIKNILLGGD